MLDFAYSGDILLLVLFLISFFLGFRLGISRVVTTLAGPILGLIAARSFSAALGAFLDTNFHFSKALLANPSLQKLQTFGNWLFGTHSLSLTLLQILSFLVIFLLVVKLTKLVGNLLHTMFSGNILGSVDGLIGGAGAMVMCWVAIIFILNWLFPLLLPASGSGPAWLQSVADALYGSQFIWPYIRDFSADLLQKGV